MPEFPVNGPVTVAFKIPSGTVEVVAEERATASVEVRPADGRDESRRLADETTVELHGDVVTVTAPDRHGFRLRTGSLAVRALVPVGSGVQGKVASADTVCRGPLGTVNLDTASGDVQVEETTGDAVVNTASGDVRLGRVDGHVRAKSASGDIHVRQVGGSIAGKVASGDIEVEEAATDISLESASGDVTVGRARSGTARISTASGDIRIGIVAGTGVWFDVRTLSGSTRNGLDMGPGAEPGDGGHLTLQLRTLSGDIDIHRA